MADPLEETPSHLVRLNPEQYDAVTTTRGPLLILAGAGSGKTRVLTRRIAHMLHEGVDPKNVLAVTFTNKAASEMKERVEELIGAAGAHVWVSTFHSTCCRILREDIEALGYTRRFAIYDDDDQVRLIRDIVDDNGWDRTKVVPRAIAGRIDHYKNRMLGVDDVVAQKRSHVNDPLVLVWREYDEALKASDALDFNDLIGVTVRLFKEHPAVLEKWRERFQYVMVDEYQDTNKGQYDLLRLIAEGHRNLAVVGDDDQSIYGFRGADVSNILNFEKDYPEAKVVRLEQNYRSSAHILALSNAVVAKNSGRLDKKLWTQAPDGPKVQLVSAESDEAEAEQVAAQILQLRRMGHAWSDIAIIYRTNATSRLYERELQKKRIPHRIVGGRKFYERREVRDLLCYLRLVVNPADDAAFLRVINVPTRGIGAKTLSELRGEANTRGLPLLRTARARGEGRTKAGKGLKSFVDIIDELTEAARDLPPYELAARAIARSGYKAMLEGDVDEKGNLSRDAKGRIENLEELVKDAASFDLEGHATTIDALAAWLDRIALAADTDDIPEEGEVTLLTVHSSKGLEYPVVFVVQMVEGRFPHQKSEEVGVDEERRLAYVAFTRAMKRLVVTRCRTMSNYGRANREPTEPSRFLFGIPEEVVTGDLPNGDPAEAVQRTLDEPARTKLQTLVRHRRARDELPEPAPEVPSERHTLIDIEDPSQLARGVRVHHPRWGVGEVRHVQAARIQVAFLNGQQHWLPLRGAEMQLVVE